MRRVAHVAIGLAIVATLGLLYIHEAAHTGVVAFDEPLWFMRSRVTPADLSTPEYRYWAIDIPGVDRWVYYAVLKATGCYDIPPGEKPCWSIIDGCFAINGFTVNAKQAGSKFATIDEWEAEHGRYAPKGGIMVLRTTNVVTFIACLFLMWLTARMVLKSNWLAAFSVLPLILSPTFSKDISFIIGSGDVFMAAALAAVIAAWTYFHLKGRGTSWVSIFSVSVLAGIATSSKHPGALAVAAFAAYLAWQSRGWRRVIYPLAACAISVAVFTALNPAVIAYPGERPWNVLALMVKQRGVIIAQHMGRTPFSATECFTFFWFPILPVAVYSLWMSRREPWFPSVGLWALFLTVGVVTGMTGIRIATDRYLAPLEMGVYFPVSLAMLSLGRRLAAKTEAAG